MAWRDRLEGLGLTDDEMIAAIEIIMDSPENDRDGLVDRNPLYAKQLVRKMLSKRLAPPPPQASTPPSAVHLVSCTVSPVASTVASPQPDEATNAMRRLGLENHYMAEFVITEGVEYANKVLELASRDPLLKGYMDIQTMNQGKESVSTMHFKVVCDEQLYLQSFVDVVAKLGVAYNKSEPEHKLKCRCSHIVLQDEEQHALKCTQKANALDPAARYADPRLLKPFHMTARTFELKFAFEQEVKSRKPSELGWRSDSEVSSCNE